MPFDTVGKRMSDTNCTEREKKTEKMEPNKSALESNCEKML